MSGDWVVAALFLIAAVLLLSRLENGCLWQDEAETAVLARNTRHFGYPRAFDGRNLIEVPASYGRGPAEAWIYSPWLPFYLLAGVFALAGESTWAARMPFALLCLLTVFLTWRLARRLTENRTIRRLSVALMAGSVPFLLHMRQCRYYSLAAALVLAVCLAYLMFLREPTGKRATVLGAALVLLFHATFGTFVPVFAAVLTHQALWGTPQTRRRSILLCAVVTALTLPWALFFYRSGFVGTFSLGRVARHFEYYVRITNKYLMPLAAMAVGSGLLWLTRRRPAATAPRRPPEAVWFLALMAAAQLAFLLVPDQRHMRYLIPAFPLLALAEAWWLAGWWARSRWAGAILTALALFTNALQSPRPRLPLADFMGELTHAYRGPMDGVVEYLREHARPGDVAKIPYDDRTLMFYTTLAVEPPSDFLRESYPRWIIIRRDWIPKPFFNSEYFRRIEAGYDRIVLDGPDVLWQNREDPGSHHFRTVQGVPPVVIYRKREI